MGVKHFHLDSFYLLPCIIPNAARRNAKLLAKKQLVTPKAMITPPIRLTGRFPNTAVSGYVKEPEIKTSRSFGIATMSLGPIIKELLR